MLNFENKIMLLFNNPKLRKSIGTQAKIDAKKHTWKKREIEFNKMIRKIRNEKFNAGKR